MVKRIESDGVGIVVWHIDRPYRSPRELEDLFDLVEGKGMVVVPVAADSTIDLSSSDGISSRESGSRWLGSSPTTPVCA